jgi:hypothetical protein
MKDEILGIVLALAILSSIPFLGMFFGIWFTY